MAGFYLISHPAAQAWKEIRRASDPLRMHLEEVFDEEELGRYFPLSGHPIPKNSAILDHAGRRLIAGLTLFME